MKSFAIILCLSFAVLAAAAPQGYNYNRVVSQALPVGNLRPQTPIAPSGIYSVGAAPAVGQYNVQQQQQIQTIQTVAPAQPVQQIVQQPQAIYQQPQQVVQTVQQPQSHFVQRPAIVTKDIYIHSAPDDTEDLSQAPQIENVPVRKNYRIVFIKAPTQNLRHTAAALKRAQATNEEKTVIYVLSKKPDINEIHQHLQVTQTDAKVHKPEVYFIKYKTQEEAQRAQQEIQAQYDALGGATHISDEGIAPITSVSGGSLNLGNIVPQHILQQPQVQTISQPQSHAILQTQAGGGFSSSTFQSNSLSSGINYASTLPVNKYLPVKTKK